MNECAQSYPESCPKSHFNSAPKAPAGQPYRHFSPPKLIETEGEGVDVAGDFDVGGDLGACVDF